MRFRLLAPVMVLFLALASWVQAQQPTGEVLFETDFEASTIPSEIEVFGNWALTTEEGNRFLRGTGVDWNDFLFFSEGVTWTNYIFEAEIRLGAGRSYIDFRSPDTACRGYEMVIAPDESQILLLTLDDAADQCQTLNSLDTVDNYTFVLDEWTPVQIQANGDQLAVLINGKQVMAGQDSNHPAGTVKIFVGPEGIVDVDNIRVTLLEAATAAGSGGRDQATLPPAPTRTPAPTRIPPTPTLPSANTLQHYAGTYQEAVAELESLGVIPPGSTLLFWEDYAWFNGAGQWFTPLAARSPRTDIIMAGELTFEPGSTTDLEICSLLSRVVMNSADTTAINYLNVAFVNDGSIVLLDYSVAGGGDPTTLEFADLRLDYSKSHHLLYTAIGDRVSVYIDGELVFEDIPVVERQGTFGIALQGTTINSRCEGRNIWVYSY